MDILKILLVDDEERYRKSISEMLSNTGMGVVSVSSAEEAIKILPDSDFNVAIIDVEMPGRDGLTVLDFIMEKRLPTKVIMMPETNEEALVAGVRGAQTILSKPFNLKILCEKLIEAQSKKKIYLDKKPQQKQIDEKEKKSPFPKQAFRTLPKISAQTKLIRFLILIICILCLFILAFILKK